MLAQTPHPPYYAVIFVSERRERDEDAYDATAARMVELAGRQPGYLGHDSARSRIGITVSYWADLDAVSAWRRQLEHVVAQDRGRRDWYRRYSIRVARVDRAYDFEAT